MLQCLSIRALRRRHSFGGGAPGDFDRRQWRADRFFSAVVAAFSGVGVKKKHVGLVLPWSSHHARCEYDANRHTSQTQHPSPFI